MYEKLLSEILDRTCNEDYKYKDMIIPKGTVWGACIYALHHDPKIYPDPEKFDPERLVKK